MFTDTAYYVNNAYNEGKNILTEGANAVMLDIDHGTYPMVTSSTVVLGGAASGLGIPPSRLDCTVGIVKAYTTRVGKGPFPTELTCDVGEHIQDVGAEVGTTTGRKRRCGWLDIPLVQYTHMLSGFSSINITKLDVLNDLEEIKIGVKYVIDVQELPPGMMPDTMESLGKVEVVYESLPGWQSDISDVKRYEDLPENAQKYCKRIEELLGGLPISWVGTGPGRLEMATQGFDARH